MLNKFIACAILLSGISFANAQPLACEIAVPTDNPNFCGSFKTAVQCNCEEGHHPHSLCSDMSKLYTAMMVKYWGNLKKACEDQKVTSAQVCIDSWNCYRKGGKDSLGRNCSGTGKAC